MDTRFALPMIALDRGSRVPLHRQIYEQAANAIRSGVIEHGTRLPSTRLMAKLLEVSRNTVLEAYDNLAADGLLRGQQGSGMRVNGKTRELTLFGLRGVIQAAGYPARTLAIEDPDKNPLYLNLR